MNPDQLQNLIDSGDPAQIEQAQKFLRDAGIYQGQIDGDAGNLTQSALAAYRTAQSQDQGPTPEEVRMRELDLQDRQETEQQEEEAEKESPAAIARRAGATIAAPAAGYALGRWGIGGGLNRAADIAQSGRNVSLSQAAENRLSGLATREGARAGAQRSGALPPRNAFLRIGGRMLPHSIAGGAMIGKGGAVMAGMDEDDPPVRQDLDTATSLALMGTGAGAIERGAAYATSPGVSPNAGDISIIESNQLNRNARNRMLGGGQTIEGDATPVQDTSRRVEAQPAQAADDVEATTKARSNALYDTMTRDQLRDQARKARLPTSGSKRALADRIAAHDKPIKGRVSRAASKAGNVANKAFLPATVGAMAADAAYNAAEAGQGAVEPGTGMRAEGDGTNRMLATTGGAAGGTAAGYGLQRGLERAGEVASRVAPTATRLAGRALPVAGAGLTAYDAYRTFQDNPPQPGPKYPTTRDVSSAYSDYMGYSGETQGEEDAGFERDMEDLVSMMDQLP